MRLYRAELRKGEDLTGALVLAFEHDGLWLWIVTAKQEPAPPEGRRTSKGIWWKAINGRGDEIVQLAKTNWLR